MDGMTDAEVVAELRSNTPLTRSGTAINGCRAREVPGAKHDDRRDTYSMTSNNIDVADEQALAAARFRALSMLPAGVMHGSAGVDPVTGRMLYEPGQVHFGAELTTIADEGGFTTSWARVAIRAIATDVLALDGRSAGDLVDVPTGQSEAMDAERWQALMRLPRIRVMAYRGTVDDASTAIVPIEPGTFWFKAEFWSKPTGRDDEQTEPTMGRLCLTALADDILATRGDG